MNSYVDDLMTKARKVKGKDLALYAKVFLGGRGIPHAMQTFGSKIASHRLQKVLETKSAVDAGTVADSTWAGPLSPFQNMVDGFIESLQPYSAYDAMYASMVHLPLRTRIIVASTGAQASADSPLASTPISALNFKGGFLEAKRVEAAVIVSDELARFMGAASTDKIGEELRISIAKETDTLFASILTASTGIATNSSTGLSAAEFQADVATAIDSISIGANSKLFLIVPVTKWGKISLLRDNGGTLITNGRLSDLVTVVPSSGVTDEMLLVDAVHVAAMNAGLEFVPSSHANVSLTDASTAEPQQSQVSLWQNNLSGLKVNRWMACELLRSDGAAIIADMTA